jgi:hypothetical protein
MGGHRKCEFLIEMARRKGNFFVQRADIWNLYKTYVEDEEESKVLDHQLRGLHTGLWQQDALEFMGLWAVSYFSLA